jgi:hypothetical protein
MSHGTPIYPFENPMHAVALIGFGVVVFLFATGIRLVVTHKDKLFGVSIENPSQSQRKGGLFTPVEMNRALSPIFWSVYGGAGRVGQWIGLAVASGGLFALIGSISKKFY